MTVDGTLNIPPCACGETAVMAVAPGDAGAASSHPRIVVRRPVPMQAWCAACWNRPPNATAHVTRRSSSPPPIARREGPNRVEINAQT